MSKGNSTLSGVLKGVPTAQILYRIVPRQSKLGYFGIRYYPQNIVPAVPVKAYEHFETHTGVSPLNDRILFTCQTSITKTSKSAVIRSRLRRRLQAAFLLKLKQQGPSALPAQPMNIVLTPTMAVLHAPFEELQEDLWQTYVQARDDFQKLSLKKKLSVTPKPTARPLPGQKRRPELKGDGVSQKVIATTIRNLPQSEYLNQFGGSAALLERMQRVITT